jgi:hypothetical protein
VYQVGQWDGCELGLACVDHCPWWLFNPLPLDCWEGVDGVVGLDGVGDGSFQGVSSGLGVNLSPDVSTGVFFDGYGGQGQGSSCLDTCQDFGLLQPNQDDWADPTQTMLLGTDDFLFPESPIGNWSTILDCQVIANTGLSREIAYSCDSNSGLSSDLTTATSFSSSGGPSSQHSHSSDSRSTSSGRLRCTWSGCLKFLKDKRGLVRHLAVHRGEKKECPRCGKILSPRGDNLNRHMKTACKARRREAS